ncbi:MAG TPA: DUF3592 domain-containing protein [Tepidisphaeraceae bacterium]|jgi:hypothetical protein|nr:DUF3592 domain-containing protein [Tepidisphaeraceae bacterium]
MATYARLPWGFSAAFTAVGVLVAGGGLWFVVVQHYRLATYLPVEARVLESHVARDGKDTYEPIIRYAYVVSHRRYEGDRVAAIGNFSTNGTWPWRVCAQFPDGANTTAWYCDRDPARGFLIRSVLFAPYIFAMAGFVFLIVGAYAFVQSIRGRQHPVPLERGHDGMSELHPEFSIRRAFYVSAIAAVAWYVYYSLVLGDYLVLKKNPSNLQFVIFAAIAAAVGIVWLVRASRFWWLRHDFMDAHLSVDRTRLCLGDTVRLRLHQPIARRIEIEELSLGAVCMRSDRRATRTTVSVSVNYTPATVASSVYKKLSVNRDYPPGAELSAACEFTLPTDAPESSPPNTTMFPIHQWFFVLEVVSRHQPKLYVRFPIIVGKG